MTKVNCLYALCQEQNIGLLNVKSNSNNGKLLVCSRSSAFTGTMVKYLSAQGCPIVTMLNFWSAQCQVCLIATLIKYWSAQVCLKMTSCWSAQCQVFLIVGVKTLVCTGVSYSDKSFL